jgi:hypothetical protein
MKKKARPSLFFLVGLVLLTGCGSVKLSVRTAYCGEEQLAAYYVGTPDPNLSKPLIGQRLILTWSLPKRDYKHKTTFLDLKVRFKDKTEEHVHFPIVHRDSYYIFHVSDKKFIESGGILTYKAEMQRDGTLIKSWYHPLWAELITFE